MKSNYIALFFLFFSVNTYSFSQTITDFFLELPDSSIMELTQKQRIEIIKYSLDNNSYDDAINDLGNAGRSYAFSKVDIKNGFIEMIGNFEGFLQMCYWNLTNGNKLIAVYQYGSGPVGYVERFDFYIFDGKQYELANFDDIIPPDLQRDFFSGDYESEMRKMEEDDVVATLLFDLPRQGKNIVVKWGNEDSRDTYQKYGIVGNRMELVWEDGKFVKGKVDWEE